MMVYPNISYMVFGNHVSYVYHGKKTSNPQIFGSDLDGIPGNTLCSALSQAESRITNHPRIWVIPKSPMLVQGGAPNIA